ncbi:MAG: glycosyltransferase family 4 protein, partial [Anaerolineales bacterium]|nr:glycosyltransferase family 4 protein [Anaerolineales bacterium]
TTTTYLNETMLMEKIRVLHPITRLIIGGAQENTMLTADYLNHRPEYAGQYDVSIVSGPQTGPEGSLIEEVQARGIPLTIMPELLREVSPANDLRALMKLTKMMRNGRFHIVHSHSSKAGVLGRVAAKLAGVPLIVHTVHGWSFHEQMSPRKLSFYVALEKIGDWCGDATIVVTAKDRDKGVAQGIKNAAHYTLIRSGIELDRFGHPQISPAHMRQQLGIPQDALVVGSVTRLSAQKAPLDLVTAIIHVLRQQPDTWFVIVGDGELRPDVERALQTAGIANQVVLTGLRRDIPELMAAFDVFVLSSLWEGLPRVLPQAMATGLPIVCTQADGSAEAVIEGENGFLVTKGQPEELANKVVMLLKNEGLRQQMGENGRIQAPLFSAELMVADIDALYRRLLPSRV